MIAKRCCFVDGDGLAGVDSQGEVEGEKGSSEAGASDALLNAHDE
jgi:hypothetical protein